MWFRQRRQTHPRRRRSKLSVAPEPAAPANRPAEAEPILRHAIEVLGARWGAEDYRVDIARISLGRALTGLGRTDEAREVLSAALDRLTTGRGPDDELTQRAREALERSRAR